MLRSLALSLCFAFVAAPALAVDGRDMVRIQLADESAIEVVVTVVHARPGEGGVAPELAKLGHYLLKSFPNYRTFVRLSTSEQRLAVGAKGKLTLPNGTELVFEHTGWKDGFAALHLDVGGLTTTVNVKDGGTFFQAGRGYDGGMIVLAFEIAATR